MNKTKTFQIMITGPEVEKVDLYSSLQSLDETMDFELVDYEENLYTKSKPKQPRNKFEHRIFSALKDNNVQFKYESEKIPYLITGHYIPDFILTTKAGKIYIETKGHFRPEAKRKMVAVKKLNPQLDIRLLFYSHNKTYIKWCERYGFKWAIGSIPEDWLNGL